MHEQIDGTGRRGGFAVRWNRGGLTVGRIVGSSLLAATVALAGCGTDDSPLEKPLAGGDTSIDNRTSHAYKNPSSNLTQAELDKHMDGDVAFEAVFVAAPADINPGLGPTFNHNACSACHIRNGRGMPSVGSGFQGSQLLVRVSDPDAEPAVPGGAGPVEGIGTQIGDHAIYGASPEAQVKIAWLEVPGKYGDGTAYTLRKPQMTITLPDGSPLPSHIQVSPRLPPPVFGLGLLEAVPDATIEGLADPDDADGDGISGRPNYVHDAQTGGTSLGRFGHKAGNPTLLQQAAGAYAEDMGVANPLNYGADGLMDIDDLTLELAAYYTQTLAVPNQVNWDDPTVLRGQELFDTLRCSSCHVPEMTTGVHPEIPALSHQEIRPYTDLLLHDLGEALADNRPDFQADGREWRTPPLWGIGLTETVLGGAAYLHDGRARTLEEAILWHGGEAKEAREGFRTLPVEDRNALVFFLLSL